MSRLIGWKRGAKPGPTLVLVAGLHGNEGAGVDVCRRLFMRLNGPVSGEIVAYAGNTAALAAKRRYLVRDLNRQWIPESIEAARSADGGGDAETASLLSLSRELDEILAEAKGPVFALDLHTTSAEGVPFSILGRSAGERAFAASLEMTGTIGLTDRTPGTLAGYLSARGCTALAIEGGQHESASARENLDAALTLALAGAGLVEKKDLAGYDEAKARLAKERGALPALIEVVSRHEVGAGFAMEPGFRNIQQTAAGTLLAREASGEVRAPFDGYVLLPLYQAQGEDGFFYGRAHA